MYFSGCEKCIRCMRPWFVFLICVLLTGIFLTFSWHMIYIQKSSYTISTQFGEFSQTEHIQVTSTQVRNTTATPRKPPSCPLLLTEKVFILLHKPHIIPHLLGFFLIWALTLLFSLFLHTHTKRKKKKTSPKLVSSSFRNLISWSICFR